MTGFIFRTIETAKFEVSGDKRERTTAQVLSAPVLDGRVPKPAGDSVWTKKVREMRRDPTLGFARDLVSAPLLAADWTVETDAVEGEPDSISEELEEASQQVFKQIAPLRLHLLRHALNGLIDFGWQTFEKVYHIDDDGFVAVDKVKPLLHDFTEIAVDLHGEKLGVVNRPLITSFFGLNPPSNYPPPEIGLLLDKCMIFSRGVEGTNWYGEPLMRRAEYPYDQWKIADEAAARYYDKLAGAHWVVHFPIGTSIIEGVEKDNYTIAQEILDGMKSSGKIAVPRQVIAFVDDLNRQASELDAWKIEILSAQGSPSATFTERERHLESLMVRALNIPERAVLEGQYGTKAEAEAHADFAITLSELWHQELCWEISRQLGDQIIVLNYGKRFVKRIHVKPAPLTDSKRAIISQIYTQLLSSPDGMAEEFDRIDVDAMRDKLGVPTRTLDPDEEKFIDELVEARRKRAIEGQVPGQAGTPGEEAPGAEDGGEGMETDEDGLPAVPDNDDDLLGDDDSDDEDETELSLGELLMELADSCGAGGGPGGGFKKGNTCAKGDGSGGGGGSAKPASKQIKSKARKLDAQINKLTAKRDKILDVWVETFDGSPKRSAAAEKELKQLGGMDEQKRISRKLLDLEHEKKKLSDSVWSSRDKLPVTSIDELGIPPFEKAVNDKEHRAALAKHKQKASKDVAYHAKKEWSYMMPADERWGEGQGPPEVDTVREAQRHGTRDPEIKALLKRHEKMLKEVPNFEGTVYRAIKVDKTGDFYDKLITPGSVINVDASSSATKSFEKSLSYGDIVLRVKTKSGADISHLEGVRNHEVILRKGTQYRVTKVHQPVVVKLKGSEKKYHGSGTAEALIIELEEITHGKKLSEDPRPFRQGDLTLDEDASKSDCGAGGGTGKPGFQPGNTCGKGDGTGGGSKPVPKTADNLAFVQKLGGSTGATLWEDEDGSKFVVKEGKHAKHVKEEYYANKAYEAAGVLVPSVQLEEIGSDYAKQISEFVEGKTIGEILNGDYIGDHKANIIKKAQQGFAMDCLLANWDSVGMALDNMVVTKDGEVVRIDNGGSMRYRAQGGDKGAAFGTEVMELETLRQGKNIQPGIYKKPNLAASKIFGGLTDAEVAAQIKELSTKESAILKALPKALHKTIIARMDYMKKWAEEKAPGKVTEVVKLEPTKENLNKLYTEYQDAVKKHGISSTATKEAFDAYKTLSDKKYAAIAAKNLSKDESLKKTAAASGVTLPGATPKSKNKKDAFKSAAKAAGVSLPDFKKIGKPSTPGEAVAMTFGAFTGKNIQIFAPGTGKTFSGELTSAVPKGKTTATLTLKNPKTGAIKTYTVGGKAHVTSVLSPDEPAAQPSSPVAKAINDSQAKFAGPDSLVAQKPKERWQPIREKRLKTLGLHEHDHFQTLDQWKTTGPKPPPPVTSGQKAAVKRYVSASYSLNSYLWHGTKAGNPETVAKFEKQAKNLQSYIEDHGKPRTVHRRVPSDVAADTVARYKEAYETGQDVIEKGFLSTSSGKDFWGSNVVLKIAAKKAASVAGVAMQHQGEQEFLLRRGARTRVLKIEEKEEKPKWSNKVIKKTLIYLEEID